MIRGANFLFGGGGTRPYDAEVEYLKGDGNAYIDTLIQNDPDFEIEVDCSSELNSYDNTILSAYSSATDGTGQQLDVRIQSYQDWRGYINFYGNGQTFSDTGWTNRGIKKITPSSISWNGISASVSIATPQKPYKGTIGLFAVVRANKTVANIAHNVSIYSVKIRKNSVLVADYIPVRVGSVGYMYDRANPNGGPLGNGLYPNAGSGAFVVGGDVN